MDDFLNVWSRLNKMGQARPVYLKRMTVLFKKRKTEIDGSFPKQSNKKKVWTGNGSRCIPCSWSSAGGSKSKTHCGEEAACHCRRNRTAGTVSRQSTSLARTHARQSLPPRLASCCFATPWRRNDGAGALSVSRPPRRGCRSSSPWMLLGLPMTMRCYRVRLIYALASVCRFSRRPVLWWSAPRVRDTRHGGQGRTAIIHRVVAKLGGEGEWHFLEVGFNN
jgi:hypothetical protein